MNRMENGHGRHHGFRRAPVRKCSSVDGEQAIKTHKEAVGFLSRPGSVLAQREDIYSDPFTKPKFLGPRNKLKVTFRPDKDFLGIVNESRAEFGLHLKSNLAQAGLTYENLAKSERDPSQYEITLINVGPNTLILPADYKLPLGNPFGHAKKKYSEKEMEEELKKIKRENKSSTGKGNKFILLPFGEETHLGIEMARMLIDGENGEPINLKELARGTDRENLHRQIGIVPFDGENLRNDSIYLLMETEGPIHYPKGQGVLMQKGVVIIEDLSTGQKREMIFDHGPSNLGQYRSHTHTHGKQFDKEHSLIGEFHFPPEIIKQLSEGKKIVKVYMTALPVKLAWVENGELVIPS